MAALGAGRPAKFFLTPGHLDGIIAVGRAGFDLRHGTRAERITVTACTRPAASPTWVIPSFFPINPLSTALLELISTSTPAARSSLPSASIVCWSRLQHVEQTFMRTNLEMLA